jgi:hypothetical protein
MFCSALFHVILSVLSSAEAPHIETSRFGDPRCSWGGESMRVWLSCVNVVNELVWPVQVPGIIYSYPFHTGLIVESVLLSVFVPWVDNNSCLRTSGLGLRPGFFRPAISFVRFFCLAVNSIVFSGVSLFLHIYCFEFYLSL